MRFGCYFHMHGMNSWIPMDVHPPEVLISCYINHLRCFSKWNSLKSQVPIFPTNSFCLNHHPKSQLFTNVCCLNIQTVINSASISTKQCLLTPYWIPHFHGSISSNTSPGTGEWQALCSDVSIAPWQCLAGETQVRCIGQWYKMIYWLVVWNIFYFPIYWE